VTTRQALRRSIEGFSNTLGPTPGEVAGSLAELNARGVPKDSTQCALARCLWAIVGTERSVINVAVTDRSIHVKRSPGHLPIIVRLPKAVRTFIRAFDSGCYPELIANGKVPPTAALPSSLVSLRGGRGEPPVEKDSPSVSHVE
jgi:hypothetical protein